MPAPPEHETDIADVNAAWGEGRVIKDDPARRQLSS